MTSAAVYVRVSSKKQAAEEKTSLADQEKECRTYAEREGWPVAAVGRDMQTGFETMDQRPALQEVRDLIQSSGAGVLLVWRFDRAARDQVDLMVLNREVRNAGAVLVSATEGPVEDSAAARGLLAIRGMAAEIEREGLIARTQGAIRTRVESGKLLTGPVPKYGLTWTGARKDTYAINPETGPVVQRMYQMADDGMSLHDITRTLNDEGIPPPSRYLAEQGYTSERAVANSWRRQGVYVLLKDPAYMGKHVLYKRKRVKGKTVLVFRDETDEKLITQDIPALVTPEQWQRVQAALSGHALFTNNDALDDMPLLSRGIAICGHCGARCIAAKHQRGYRGYRCPNRMGKTDGDRPSCPGGSYFIKAETVDDDVWAKVEEMAADTERFQAMIMAPIHEAQAQLERVNKQEATLAAELEQAKKERDTLSRRMATEEDDQIHAIYRAQLKDTLALIAELERRMGGKDRKEARLKAYLDVLLAHAGAGRNGRIRLQVIPPPGTPPLSEEQLAHAIRHPDQYPGWTFTTLPPERTREEKRALLRAIGVQVMIYAGKSDWAKAHDGRRWDLQIVPQVSFGMYPGVDACESTPLIYTWADWERAGQGKTTGRKASKAGQV